MSRVELLEPVFQDGIQNTNFFNGRLLSAEDLRTEQRAARAQRAQLAEAVGAGVVRGLRVARAGVGSPPGSTASAVVTVSAGLAFNGSGQALELRADTEVALVREADTAATGAGLFATCEPPETTAVVAGVGVYLLTLSPASGYVGRAPASGLGGEPLSGPGCGSRYAVEGVRFRLLELNAGVRQRLSPAALAALAALSGASTPPGVSLLRNLLAHFCLGGGRDLAFARRPFGDVAAGEDAEDLLAAFAGSGALTPCDVPLALVHWTTGGIGFVDEWAVRRAVAPRPAGGEWRPPLDARARAAAEARFLQFQAHLEEVRAAGPNPHLLVASDYFRYLPPVAFIPLRASPFAGFNAAGMFQTQVTRPHVFVEGAQAESLLRLSLAHPPIDLSSREMIWLYLVRENMLAYDEGGAARPQPYMIVANGHIPYQGAAQYDLSSWNYSNYA
jgi:hypothetical protein